MNGTALVVKTDLGNARLHLELGWLHGEGVGDLQRLKAMQAMGGGLCNRTQLTITQRIV